MDYNKGDAEEQVKDMLMKGKWDLTPSGCISHLVAYNGSLLMAHWRADTKSNEHKALGDLYDTMQELTDQFAEAYMGKYGSLVEYPKDAKIEDISKAPATEGCKIVQLIRPMYEEGEDDDLLNILADMEIACNKAKYLLKEK